MHFYELHLQLNVNFGHPTSCPMFPSYQEKDGHFPRCLPPGALPSRTISYDSSRQVAGLYRASIERRTLGANTAMFLLAGKKAATTNRLLCLCTTDGAGGTMRLVNMYLLSVMASRTFLLPGYCRGKWGKMCHGVNKSTPFSQILLFQSPPFFY